MRAKRFTFVGRLDAEQNRGSVWTDSTAHQGVETGSRYLLRSSIWCMADGDQPSAHLSPISGDLQLTRKRTRCFIGLCFLEQMALFPFYWAKQEPNTAIGYSKGYLIGTRFDIKLIHLVLEQNDEPFSNVKNNKF